MIRPYRPRRSCLAVPGSSGKMLKKARRLNSDQVFLDLEDSVAPDAKPYARENIARELREGGWGQRVRTVRVNDADTKWAHEDVLHIVREAGADLDCIMLPKVERVGHIHWLDLLLTQAEKAEGLEPGGIGIEAQIEGPAGLFEIDAIAAASPRIECLIFGPGDFMAAMQMPSLTIGAPGRSGTDPFDAVLMQIAMAARKHGIQAIDGPFAVINDGEGYALSAERAAAFGYDGKWVLHPNQVDAANEAFSPTQEAYDKAELILEAYAYYTSAEGGALGAVMLGDEMVDEASRKLAIPTVERGRRLGMRRTTAFSPAS